MLEEKSDLIISTTKPSGKLAALLSKNGVVIQPITEDEGNVDRYILSTHLAVDRRTSSSFLRGIQDKTLFTNAIYLREHYEIPVLILEGEVNYDYSAFNPQAVRGAVASMVTVYGISVLSTADVEETAALLLMLVQQEQVGVPEISLVPKRKAVTLPDLQRRVVEMLPGSGMVLARQLLQHFGSIQRLSMASSTELRQVHGIGPGKAVEIHRVLNAEYESVDTEKQLEDVVEKKPELLFTTDVKLITRQHVLITEQEERQIIDLVFFNPDQNDLILVELKLGKLNRSHELQLANYLKFSHHSPLLMSFLEGGAQIRGILATVESCEYKPLSPEISVHIIDRDAVIQSLINMRAENLVQDNT